MAVNSTANRVASLFLAILLAFTLIINSVGVVYADDGTTVGLDELGFLSTVCGMFNSVYLPSDVINSDLMTWDDVSSYSDDYKWVLKQLDVIYRKKAVELGYQYTDSSADNYVMPWFYFNGLNNGAVDSIYVRFINNGCLDFVNSMSDAEFKVIQAAYNTFIKGMYDYAYNLPPVNEPDKYNMIQLASAIDYIPVYAVSMNYPSNSAFPEKLCDLGYGYPPYGLVKQGVITSSDLALVEDTMLAFHANIGGSDSVIGRENYLCMLGTAATSGAYYSTLDILNHTLVVSDGTVSFNDTVLAVDKGSSGWNFRTVTAYYTNATQYTFKYATINNQPNTSLSSTQELTQDTLLSILCGSNVNSKMCILNPVCKAYIFDGKTMKNWADSIVIGTSDAWLTAGGFVNECQGIYYPPTVENMNSIIENYYVGKYDVSGEIVDTFLGVDTGSADIVEDEVPDFNYDRIEDAVANMGQQVTDSIDKLKDEMLHGGDYSGVNDAGSSLDDKLNEYNEKENELKDYANLDDFSESYWNVAILTDNAQHLAVISTCFMTMWDSFGPFIVIMTIALALGVAFFLLKI